MDFPKYLTSVKAVVYDSVSDVGCAEGKCKMFKVNGENNLKYFFLPKICIFFLTLKKIMFVFFNFGWKPKASSKTKVFKKIKTSRPIFERNLGCDVIFFYIFHFVGWCLFSNSSIF